VRRAACTDRRRRRVGPKPRAGFDSWCFVDDDSTIAGGCGLGDVGSKYDYCRPKPEVELLTVAEYSEQVVKGKADLIDAQKLLNSFATAGVSAAVLGITEEEMNQTITRTEAKVRAAEIAVAAAEIGITLVNLKTELVNTASSAERQRLQDEIDAASAELNGVYNPTFTTTTQTATTTTYSWGITEMNCKCKDSWQPSGAGCEDSPKYSGCGMQIPCDGDTNGASRGPLLCRPSPGLRTDRRPSERVHSGTPPAVPTPPPPQIAAWPPTAAPPPLARTRSPAEAPRRMHGPSPPPGWTQSPRRL